MRLTSVLCLIGSTAATVNKYVPWFDKAATKGTVKHPPPPPADAGAGVFVTDTGINSTFLSEWEDKATDPIDFVALDGKIYANGEAFDIKGINWWGSESRNGPPAGLNKHSIGWYFDLLAFNGFNAIRLLFNHESVLEDLPIDPSELIMAPELSGLTYTAMFRKLAEEAGKRGLLVLMGCHRISPAA